MTYAVSVVAHRPGPLTRRSTPELGAQKYTGVDVGTVMIVPGGLVPVHAFAEVSRRTEPSGWMQSCVGPGQIETGVSCLGRQSEVLVATRSSPFDFWAQATVICVSVCEAKATDGTPTAITHAATTATTSPCPGIRRRRRRGSSSALAMGAWAGATDMGSPRVRRRRRIRGVAERRHLRAQRGGLEHPFQVPEEGSRALLASHGHGVTTSLDNFIESTHN